MRLDELYTMFDRMVIGTLNVSPVDHFLFDLADGNSQESLKGAFPGIERMLMPEAGKYLVVAPIVENQDILVLLFPEQTDGSLGLKALTTKTGKAVDLTDGLGQTIENFVDFANKGEITTRFNDFAFNPNSGNSADEVKDIGSFDVSKGEPVEVKNDNITTTDNNEEPEMKFKPIDEETDDTKWVEIPNTNAHGVTVTEDGEEVTASEDPFADAAPAQDAPAEPAPAADAAPAEGGDAAPAAEPAAEPAPAEGDAAAPAETPAETPAEAPAADAAAPEIDDPKAKMRELLAYYTNYMTELVKDPATSTDLISATQDMIDSLIKNMESADSIEEVKADAEETAKEDASAEAAPAEETPAEAPAEGEAAPANEDTEKPVKEGAAVEGTEKPVEPAKECGAVEEKKPTLEEKIDAEVDAAHANDIENIEPATADDVLTPGDLRNSPVNDVSLDDVAPTPDEELTATAPDMTAQPTTDELADVEPMTPDEEVDMLGTDDTEDFGADGLPTGDYTGDIDDMAMTGPVAKKIAWSNDYALNGVATSDDNTMVVPEVLHELSDYYTKVANEVSKVPGKEDVAMKLQKIQILSKTIATEWDGILAQIGDGCCASSYDRSNMSDLEKDEIDNVDSLAQVHADVAADDEDEMEDDLAVNDQIASFVEAFKHML